MHKPIIYQISIAEHLGEQWVEWFDPLLIQYQSNGQTLLVGPVRDQAELQGILSKISNLNLTLVAVNQAQPSNQLGNVTSISDDRNDDFCYTGKD
mgnify:CR=1 FL=1